MPFFTNRFYPLWDELLSRYLAAVYIVFFVTFLLG